MLATSSNITLKRAKLVSNILHPWAVLVPVLSLAAYQEVSGSAEWVKWVLIAYVPAIAFPSLYARIRV